MFWNLDLCQPVSFEEIYLFSIIWLEFYQIVRHRVYCLVRVHVLKLLTVVYNCLHLRPFLKHQQQQQQQDLLLNDDCSLLPDQHDNSFSTIEQRSFRLSLGDFHLSLLWLKKFIDQLVHVCSLTIHRYADWTSVSFFYVSILRGRPRKSDVHFNCGKFVGD